MEKPLNELLDNLTNLKKLAKKPSEDENSGTFSSYDRSSYYDSENDRYVNWDANEDGDGIIRKEGDESVVFELEGPGVIWRTWSARPEDGNINIYFDGESEASYCRPFKKFFERITDDVSPAGFPSLMPKLSGGYNSFLPIPFQKSIKITLSENWGQFYHFTYTTFGKEENLPSFEELLSKEGLIELAKLDRKMYAIGDNFDASCKSYSSELTKGTQTLLNTHDSGALTYLAFEINPENYTSKQLDLLLRQTLLSIYWDGENNPSVCVPLGDFFGSSPGYHLVKTLSLGMTEKRMYSNWYMPYSEGVKIEILYEGTENIPFTFSFKKENLSEKEANNQLRFHAKWHDGNFKELSDKDFAKNGQRYPDWPLLLTEGEGRFCGVHLHVLDRWKRPSDNWWYGHGETKPIDWWWGEGDEKFFVDGETFPSTFGTGSEDYIGYAWAAKPPFALFDSPFAAQSNMPVDGNGHTSVVRLQICDNIPFTKKFEAFIEKYKQDHWGENGICKYEVTPFWYQEKGSNDNYIFPDLSKRTQTLNDF